MPDIPVLFEFLKRLHLFRGLSDDQLQVVAEELHDKPYPEPEVIFLEGTPADSFCLIFQGRVNITRRVKGKETKLATLVKGDYFGEQGLLTGQNRNATVQAEKGTVLLVLYRDQFKRLLTKIPGLRSNFQIVINSRRLATQLQFNWLSENEVIYFLARKHQFLLYRAMFLPLLALAPILALLVLAYLLNSATFGAVGGFLFVIDLAWGIWRYFDWGNDFYIVTNQRVIWLEKVIGLYESRSEAGMNSILSISTESDQFGRWYDYGTVVVRTFTGQVRMDYVRHPKQAASMIEEYWLRTKDVARQSDQEVIKQTIRNRLGVKSSTPVAPPLPAAKPAQKKYSLREWWRDAFKMRIEEDNIVTYRKHIYTLFRDTVIQNLGFFLLLAAPFAWSYIFGGVPPMWFWATLILLFFINVGSWLYEYLDWSNDIYQVTADQIIDIYRKPFGTEDRKAAPLENILSSEYKRVGFLGMLLNFGTVYIMVGGAQFNFDNVADPPTVQQDIIRRQQARLQKKREADTAGERERIADWLAMYHRTIEEIQRDQNQSRPENPE